MKDEVPYQLREFPNFSLNTWNDSGKKEINLILLKRKIAIWCCLQQLSFLLFPFTLRLTLKLMPNANLARILGNANTSTNNLNYANVNLRFAMCVKKLKQVVWTGLSMSRHSSNASGLVSSFLQTGQKPTNPLRAKTSVSCSLLLRGQPRNNKPGWLQLYHNPSIFVGHNAQLRHAASGRLESRKGQELCIKGWGLSSLIGISPPCNTEAKSAATKSFLLMVPDLLF